jgi:A/G-specific adenine glycosylase
MDYGMMLKQNHSNPGRRSAHHARQSRFEGSNRQLRSRMLRVVMEQPGITAEALVELLGAEPEAVKRNLEAMQREGFLGKRGRGVAIRG